MIISFDSVRRTLREPPPPHFYPASPRRDGNEARECLRANLSRPGFPISQAHLGEDPTLQHLGVSELAYSASKVNAKQAERCHLGRSVAPFHRDTLRGFRARSTLL